MKIRLKNRVTGRVVEVDTKRLRLQKLRHRVGTWIRVVKDAPRNGRLLMVTLTYRVGEEWKPYQITRFCKRVGYELGSALWGYSWVAELQERGAVHYHVLLWGSRAMRLEFPDESGAWLHGSSKVEVARSPFYLAKYLSKEAIGGYFPRGCRLYAVVLRENAPCGPAGHLRVFAARFPAYVGTLVVSGEYTCVQRTRSAWWLSQSLAGAPIRCVVPDWFRWT